MAYNKPPIDNVPFKFTKSGYTIQGFNSVEFRFGTTVYNQTSDLKAIIGAFATTTTDLSATIAPSRWIYRTPIDIGSYLNAVDPFDIAASIRAFHFADLSVALHSWAETDISARIDSHPPENLGADIYGVAPVHLSASIHGWATYDLNAFIRAFYPVDLGAQIRSTWLANLMASIAPIPAKELSASIRALHIRDISVDINGVYGPYDLQGYIRVHPSLDLSVIMRGVYSGYKNLNAVLDGWNTKDLLATMQYVYISDLNASINDVWGKANLGASIVPSTILLKRVLKVPLMEYKNLGALINFSCAGSAYKDLSVTFGTIFDKRDIYATIYGWRSSSIYNVKNLGAYINVEKYGVQDAYPITYDALETEEHSRLVVSTAAYDPSAYKVWDTLSIRYGAYSYKNLVASIIGALNSRNLGASITSVIDINYSELPDYIKPKSHEVFINLAQGESQWRRFIEIMFDKDGTTPFKYFYVDGTQKVYKIDRDRHWTIWATSYDKVDDSLTDRINIRQKFIFDMSKYATVDEAIRKLMERAAHLSRVELSASIDGGLPPHMNLSATMDIKNIYRWSRNLSAHLDVIRAFLPGTPVDMPVSIEPILNKGITNLSILVNPMGYIPLPGDALLINFESGEGYTPHGYSGIDINWTADDV